MIEFNFFLVNIREKNGEITKLKIFRDDLFKFEKEILQNYKLNYSKYSKEYLLKVIVNETFLRKYSIPKTIFLLNVLNNKFPNDNINFFLNTRAFENVYDNYIKKSFKKKINLIYVNKFQVYLSISFKSILYYFAYYYYIFFNFKKSIYFSNDLNKIYCYGENSENLFDKNIRSDFFWTFDNNLSLKRIIYNTSNLNNFYLLKKNINVSFNFKLKKYSKLNNKMIFENNKIQLSKAKFLNKKYFNFYINKYNFDKLRIKNYIKKFNIKVSFSWFKYDEKQIIFNECLNELGGISCIWQMAFDGTRMYDCKNQADINFSFSKYSASNEINNNSDYKYNIITGLPNNIITYENQKFAQKIRNNIIKNGAEKIICVLDENSSSDPRWHTGHDLQSENYTYVLEQLMNNRKLGVIFKPKNPFTLKKRLGKNYNLLEKSIDTGRCYLFNKDQKSSQKGSTLVSTAALASDLVVHSHLCAGTAAIECYLAGVPSVLIDRENSNSSKMYDLPNNKVIFKNWSEFMPILNKYLFEKNKKIILGDWGDKINEFDPFGDNKGYLRIGNFLKELIKGFDENLNKEKILNKAINNYQNKWGTDKVITNSN